MAGVFLQNEDKGVKIKFLINQLGYLINSHCPDLNYIYSKIKEITKYLINNTYLKKTVKPGHVLERCLTADGFCRKNEIWYIQTCLKGRNKYAREWFLVYNIILELPEFKKIFDDYIKDLNQTYQNQVKQSLNISNYTGDLILKNSKKKSGQNVFYCANSLLQLYTENKNTNSLIYTEAIQYYAQFIDFVNKLSVEAIIDVFERRYLYPQKLDNNQLAVFNLIQNYFANLNHQHIFDFKYIQSCGKYENTLLYKYLQVLQKLTINTDISKVLFDLKASELQEIKTLAAALPDELLNAEPVQTPPVQPSTSRKRTLSEQSEESKEAFPVLNIDDIKYFFAQLDKPPRGQSNENSSKRQKISQNHQNSLFF